MAHVYWIGTKDTDPLNDGLVGVTGTKRKKKTPGQRLEEHDKKVDFVLLEQNKKTTTHKEKPLCV